MYFRVVSPNYSCLNALFISIRLKSSVSYRRRNAIVEVNSRSYYSAAYTKVPKIKLCGNRVVTKKILNKIKY